MQAETGYWIACGYRLRYTLQPVAGEKHRAWVLLHEGLGSIGQWKNFRAMLAKACNMPVYTFERRGYGLSDYTDEARTALYMHKEAGELLDSVLNQIPQPELFLLGHSDGASIALMHQNAKVKAVVSIASHVMVEDVTLAGIRKIHESDRRAVLIRRLRKYHGHRADQVYSSWAETWLHPDFRNWDIRPELSRLTCPVLAIQGDADEYGTVKQLTEIRRNTRACCRLVMLPKCGHAPHLEQEQAVLYEITDFLRENDQV